MCTQRMHLLMCSARSRPNIIHMKDTHKEWLGPGQIFVCGRTGQPKKLDSSMGEMGGLGG